MSPVPGAYKLGNIAAKLEKKESNVFSRSRRLSPHPEKFKSTDSSLMSLYSVHTDITSSSIQSIRQRFNSFYQRQENRQKDTAMADVMKSVQHTQRYKPSVKGKPGYLPAIDKTGTFLGVSNEIFPDQNWTTKRHFNCHNKESLNEWDITKDCDRGKACHWDGVHRHVMTSFDYNSLKHRPQVLAVQRNELAEASRGDKSYQSPEYSSNFHKKGSTRPVPVFGGRERNVKDTHIPLIEPLGRRKTFSEKEVDRQAWENVLVVRDLENWRPATPLMWRPTKNIHRIPVDLHQQQPQS